MDKTVNDVTTAEQTADTSSSVEQTAQEDTTISAGEQSNTQVSEGEESKVENSIPYERFQEKVSELNQMKEQMAELKAKAEMADRFSQAFTTQAISPEEKAKQLQLDAAKKELEQLGYVDKFTIGKMVKDELDAYKWQERFVSQMDQLSKKYTGKDGGPKFDSQEVAKYMDEMTRRGNHITDPEIAFKMMNLDGLAESKAKAQKSSTFSEKPGGAVHETTDQRQADLTAAAKGRNMTDFIKKYVPIPE